MSGTVNGPGAVPRRFSVRRVLRFVWNIIKGMVFLFGIAMVILLIVGVAAFHRAVRLAGGPKLPSHYTLALDLTEAPQDLPPQSPWLRLAQSQRPTLAQTILAIGHAAHDSAVKGIDVQLGGACCSTTTAEELHNALERFRAASGKQVVAHAMSFDGAEGLGAYVVATAATRIELSQAGDFGVTGLAVATPFAGDLLRTVGINAQFEHIGKYKTYPQLFTRNAPSAANTEMLNSLADSLYTGALSPVSDRLDQSPEEVKALFDQAPFTPEAARKRGLVDAVLPLDATIDTVRDGHAASDDVGLGRYVAAKGKAITGSGTKIALIIATGDIEAPSSAAAAGAIDPRLLVAEIRGAIDDPEIKAIVLRLDTPGGTVTGSAMIGAEVQAAASAHKPLIVSMGQYDASGGYWISSHAVKIIADSGTLTGSIGVLGGKLSFGGTLQKIGVSVTTVARGANATLDSPVVPWTQPQLVALQSLLNYDYRNFVNWVAAGRHMTPEQVDAIGQGRVWTGTQAKKRGLVDAIGGYYGAFEAARAALHLSAHAPVDIVNGNESPSLHDLLAEAFAKVNPLARVVIPAGLGSSRLDMADLHAIQALAHPQPLEMAPLLVQ